MASQATALAEKLSEALNAETLSGQYRAAIKAADEAWDDVETFLANGWLHHARIAHHKFRELYSRKCWLHAQLRKSA